MRPNIERNDCDQALIEGAQSRRQAGKAGAPEGHRVRNVVHDHVWTESKQLGTRLYRCGEICSRVQRSSPTSAIRPAEVEEDDWRDSD